MVSQSIHNYAQCLTTKLKIWLPLCFACLRFRVKRLQEQPFLKWLDINDNKF